MVDKANDNVNKPESSFWSNIENMQRAPEYMENFYYGKKVSTKLKSKNENNDMQKKTSNVKEDKVDIKPKERITADNTVNKRENKPLNVDKNDNDIKMGKPQHQTNKSEKFASKNVKESFNNRKPVIKSTNNGTNTANEHQNTKENHGNNKLLYYFIYIYV